MNAVTHAPRLDDERFEIGGRFRGGGAVAGVIIGQRGAEGNGKRKRKRRRRRRNKGGQPGQDSGRQAEREQVECRGRAAQHPGGDLDQLLTEVKRLGVQPAGVNGTYVQNLPFHTRRFTDHSRVTVNGNPLVWNTDVVAVPVHQHLHPLKPKRPRKMMPQRQHLPRRCRLHSSSLL